MRLCVADDALGVALERRVALALLAALRSEAAQLTDSMYDMHDVLLF